MITVIAGTGTLPIEACKNLINQKKDFFIVVLFPEDNLKAIEELIQDPNKIIIQECYQISKVLNLLKEKNTTHVLLIGKVDKRNLLKKVKLDWLSIKLLAMLTYKDDKAIMEKILETLKENEIEVIKQSEVLNSLFVEPGIISGNLTENLKIDIELGMSVAEKMSSWSIGQTVAIKDGMILAIEAIEGTDECIQRGIKLGKENIVICKSAHPKQNQKYDLPTLGTNSLKGISSRQIAAIAWKSNQTFIADKEEFVKKAKELGISLISVK